MSDPAVTDEEGFSAAWRVVGPAVERALRRRGVTPENADDAVQETAARALARLAAGESFTSRRGLAMWAHRVARNLVTDSWRKDRRLVYRPALLTVDDAAEAAQWRVLLAETLTAMSTLTATQRRALLDLLAEDFPDDKRAQVRASVARLRARERLRRIVGELPVAWPLRRLRRVRWTVWAPTAVGSLGVCTVFVTAVVGVLDPPQAHIVLASSSSTLPGLGVVAATTPTVEPSVAAAPRRRPPTNRLGRHSRRRSNPGRTCLPPSSGCPSATRSR